jgi:hypothetical protein
VSLFSRLASVCCPPLFRPKPSAERSIACAVKKCRPSRILEIGLGDGQRARRAITLAQRYHARHEVQFIGFDLFEDRHPGQGRLSLKEAYRQLRTTGARIRLVPGDAYGALVRAANSIAQVELVLISPEVSRASLAGAWFYLPRTLAAGAMVLWADGSLPGGQYREMPAEELQSAARPARSLRRAA